MISSQTKKDECHKSKRRRLTMEEQNAIRMALDQPNKQTHDAIAKQYGVARSTVTRLLGRADMIKEEMKYASIRDKKTQKKVTRRVFTSNYSASKVVDWALFYWMHQVRSNSKELNITQHILTNKAEALAKKVGLNSFKASNGWFDGFKRRFGLASNRRCGESESFEMTEFAKTRLDIMMDMFPDIDPENIQQSLMEACSTEKRAPVDEENPDDDAILKVATSRASVLHFKEQKNDKSCRKVTDESMATIEKSISGRSKRQMDIKAFLSTGIFIYLDYRTDHVWWSTFNDNPAY